MERFHRYFNAALSIVFDKIKATWDEIIPSILFSYRASVNDTTGYSPFFLEHGRHPQLPLGTLFPYLQKKEERKEDFVKDITDKLEFAFDLARERQKVAAERNKARKHAQYKPNFKPGDFILLMERAAKEGRLEEKDEEGKHISIPHKLRNRYTGPYEMVRWAGERHCTILMRGKEVTHNVNRLIKHHVWDEEHMCTDRPHRVEEREETRPEIGDLIVFPSTYNSEHKCIFGMGRVMEIRSAEDVLIHWLGNMPCAEANKPFALGWIDGKDNLAYYAAKKTHFSHTPLTSD